MKRSLLVLAFAFLFSASVQAQSCSKCYQALEGDLFCGLTSHNGYQTCTATQGYICRLTGTCEGIDGPECKRPCVETRWVDGSRLPEKAPWVVAKVEITLPEPKHS